MTPEKELAVLMNGLFIGGLVQRKQGRCAFTYLPDWQKDVDSTPLSLSMPLQIQEHGDRLVRPFLEGLLPDSDEVLERWGSEFHVSPRNPFALLEHVGAECAGAAQFVRPGEVDAIAEKGNIEWLSEDEIADRLRTLRRDPTAWHVMTGGQFSLAGAQAKTALHRDGDRWGSPSGRFPTTHILKPAVTWLDDHDLNEHLCLRTAARLGLPTADSELREFAGERVIVIRRYDRARQNGEWIRVHQEDMCQALGVSPLRKYENEGGPSARQIVELLRAVQEPKVADESVARFVDALVFNWLIAGTDAHAKNYSVLMSGRQVRLAPLYDVASVLPYPQFDPKGYKLAMRVGGHYRIDEITLRSWLRFASELTLEPDLVVSRLVALAEALPDALSEACNDPAIGRLDSELPPRLSDSVIRRVERCRRQLAGRT